MTVEIAATRLTVAAAEIDLADHTLADKITRPVTDRTDQFMAGDPSKPHVAFKDLQIGGADAGEMNFDQRG
jgi:hypothetical protein